VELRSDGGRHGPDFTTNANHARLLGSAKCVAGAFPGASIQPLTVVINGRATTAVGAALDGAEVWLEVGDQVIARGSANSAGEYRLLASLKPGDYDLCVQKGDIGARHPLTLSESGLRTEGISCAPMSTSAGICPRSASAITWRRSLCRPCVWA